MVRSDPPSNRRAVRRAMLAVRDIPGDAAPLDMVAVVGPSATRAASTLVSRGGTLGGALRRPDWRARLDHRAACAARAVCRAVAGSEARIRRPAVHKPVSASSRTGLPAPKPEIEKTLPVLEPVCQYRKRKWKKDDQRRVPEKLPTWRWVEPLCASRDLGNGT